MLRKLLLLVCVMCATNAIAQHENSTPSKTTQKQDDPKIDYKQTGAPMPSLIFIPYYDTNSKETDHKKYMTNSDFDNGANLFVMMFNPTCSHCQDETVILGKNGSLFKRSKVLLLANIIMKPYMGDFVALTHVDRHPFMYLGVDSTDFINNLFLYQQLPQLNIYNSERKLIRTYTGEVAIDSLKKYIQ